MVAAGNVGQLARDPVDFVQLLGQELASGACEFVISLFWCAIFREVCFDSLWGWVDAGDCAQLFFQYVCT